MACLFILWVSIKWPYFDLAYLIYQGILVNPMLIVGYIVVLNRFKAYHNGVLEKFNKYMNEDEKYAINKTTNDVVIFIYCII